MGENLLALTATGRPLMKYRENTIRSFNTAAAAGASFVEFDVQVQFQNLHIQGPCCPVSNLAFLSNPLTCVDSPVHVYVGDQGWYSGDLA